MAAGTGEDSGDVDDEWCAENRAGTAGAATCHAKDVLTNYRRIGESSKSTMRWGCVLGCLTVLV